MELSCFRRATTVVLHARGEHRGRSADGDHHCAVVRSLGARAQPGPERPCSYSRVGSKRAPRRAWRVVDTFVREPARRDETARVCRKRRRDSWSGLVERYYSLRARLVESNGGRRDSAAALAAKIGCVVPVPKTAAALVPCDSPDAARDAARHRRLTRNFWWSWDPEATGLPQATPRMGVLAHKRGAFLRESTRGPGQRPPSGVRGARPRVWARFDRHRRAHREVSSRRRRYRRATRSLFCDERRRARVRRI